jgi:hypothetical protein
MRHLQKRQGLGFQSERRVVLHKMEELVQGEVKRKDSLFVTEASSKTKLHTVKIEQFCG